MTQLKRNADGSYSGSYEGIDYTVCKERQQYGKPVPPSTLGWVAQGQKPNERFGGWGKTREEAVRALISAIDQDAVQVPELDALLKRWTEEIKRIVPLLSERDNDARFQLRLLRSDLATLDRLVRSQAVRFEEGLAELRSRVQSAPAQTQIAGG
jgi:hypothetical protein